MKSFILMTVGFLIGALVTVVAVFIYIQMSVGQTSDNGRPAVVKVEDSEAAKLVPAEGIPLSDLPLSEGQRQAIKTAGVDTENYRITKETAACIESKIGAKRAAEIIGGAAPSLLEIGSISGCI